MNRYSIFPGALQLDSLGSFVAYDDHVRISEIYEKRIAELKQQLDFTENARVQAINRMLERAQRAERQVINAARALGYVDDAD